jgi:hypothetical protein
MKRRLLLVTAALWVAVAGCSKKKKAHEEAPPPPAVEGLKALPAATEVVIGFDAQKLVGSQVIKRATHELFRRESGLRAEFDAVLTACKLDISKDIEAGLLALVPTANGRDGVLVVRGRLEEAEITACVGRFLSESGGKLESGSAAGRTIYHQAPEGLWFTFSADKTLLAASSKEALRLILESPGSLADKDAPLAAYLGKAQMDSALWGAALLEDQVAQGLQRAAGVQAKAIIGSLDLDAGLKASLRVETDSEGGAQKLAERARSELKLLALMLQAGKVGPLVNKVSIEPRAEWLHLGWSLDDEELAELLAASFPGLSSTIDSGPGNDQNPSPEPDSPAEDAGKKEN